VLDYISHSLFNRIFIYLYYSILMKIKIKYILLCCFFFCCLILSAQNETNNDSNYIENKAELLTKKINKILILSDYQNKKVKEIYLQYLKDLFYIMNDKSINNMDLVHKERSINTRLNKNMQSILSPRQKNIYSKIIID